MWVYTQNAWICRKQFSAIRKDGHDVGVAIDLFVSRSDVVLLDSSVLERTRDEGSDDVKWERTGRRVFGKAADCVHKLEAITARDLLRTERTYRQDCG